MDVISDDEERAQSDRSPEQLERSHWTAEQRLARLEGDFERFRHRQAHGAFILFNSFKMTRAERVEYARQLLRGTDMKVVNNDT